MLLPTVPNKDGEIRPLRNLAKLVPKFLDALYTESQLILLRPSLMLLPINRPIPSKLPCENA